MKNVSKKVFESACILGCSVSTNCPKGGDSGHGGITIFELIDMGSTDLRVNDKEVDSVKITLGGDCESEVFIKALKFAYEELLKQTNLNIKEINGHVSSPKGQDETEK